MRAVAMLSETMPARMDDSWDHGTAATAEPQPAQAHTIAANASNRPCPETSLVTAALRLAADRCAVFPCHLSKRPATPRGFKDASRDPDVIRVLWHRWPGDLIGIATGEASGLAVLDIDAKPEGRDWWREHRARMPATRTVRTRSGGLHLYFHHLPGLRCSVSVIAPAIDVRADGGYVIAWAAAGLPVVHQGPLASWPAWLTAPKQLLARHDVERPRVPDKPGIAALVRFVAHAPVRERNNRLFWAACRMSSLVRSRMLEEHNAEAILVAAAREAGLPDAEARRTAQSGLAAGRHG